jgi:hypothetical protein
MIYLWSSLLRARGRCLRASTALVGLEEDFLGMVGMNVECEMGNGR